MLVLDDTDRWLTATWLPDSRQTRAAFFTTIPRLLSEELDAAAVIAVHPTYLDDDAYRAARGFLSRTIAVPAVPYLQALGFQRDGLIQAMGISFTTSTVVLALGLAANGSYPAAVLGGSVAMLVPAVGGMVLGTWLRQRLPVAVFRRCFLIGLTLLGAYMALRAAV